MSMQHYLGPRSPRAILLSVSAILLAATPAASAPILDEPVAIDSDLVTPIAPDAGDIVAPDDVFEQIGLGEASYYGHELAGNRTASGERFDPGELTAAHRSLPLGSRLRVTNLANGLSTIVRVNDRGPFHKSRIIDVSLSAARKIKMIASGKARVRLELLR